jgi:hypothetical protein
VSKLHLKKHPQLVSVTAVTVVANHGNIKLSISARQTWALDAISLLISMYHCIPILASLCLLFMATTDWASLSTRPAASLP